MSSVEAPLVRPALELSCVGCGAGDIRTYVYDLAERDLCVRLVCIGCGAVSEAGRWVRPGGLSAGVHASVAKAPEGEEKPSVGWRWGLTKTLTPPPPAPPVSPKRGRGRPRLDGRPPGYKPWIAAGVAKTTWYKRKRKAKLKA